MLPVFTACSSDSDDPAAGTVTLDSSVQSLYEFGPESDSFTVKFTATVNWTVSALSEDGSACKWLTFGSDSGAGGIQTLKVILATNQQAATRTAVVTVKAGTSTQTFRVSQTGQTTQFMTEADVKDFDKYYKPEEFAKMDMLRSDSKWSWFRSKQSEHFFVFWEAGFGDDPNGEDVPSNLRVDIDDMLAKAEQFYTTNVEKMKMVTVGQGKSYLDKYKMEIYLLYQTEWLATGSGYDNTIGALWVNPSTCQPVGSVIAHEIGHSFQYQVSCDKDLNGVADLYKVGFRYGYGTDGAGGNGFWEQCAQWASFQDYPQQAFLEYFDTWKLNCHRHFCHEFMRYASFWFQYYWAEKHGIDAVARIWNESAYPEDPVMTYKRIYCNDNLDALYADVYDYATRMVTFDLDGVRTYSTGVDRTYTTTMCDVEDGYYRVAYSSCPSTTGFNIITLNTPEAGTTVKANFRGLAPGSALAADDPGKQVDTDQKTVGTATTYNGGTASQAGWRYGFVAVDKSGKAHYGDMFSAKEGTATYTVPANTEKLCLVVVGAPTTYKAHVWDDDESNDAQWPYEVKFEGTDLPGHFSIDETAAPKSITLTYDLTCDATSENYVLGTIDLSNSQELAQAFVMKPVALEGKIAQVGTQPAEGKIVIGLKQPDGTYAYTSTANNGFWCKATGALGAWGDASPIYVEFNGLTWTYGAYPGEPQAGTTYTIRPTLIYTIGGQQYTAEVVLNYKF
jgi:hypothetical protein